MSDENPLEIGHLKLYSNKLEFKGVRCNFIDIEHIGWYWQSKTTNIINTQTVKLSLHIIGRKEPIYIKMTTMYVTPKLVAAYNLIAKQTFQNRLNFYTKQLEQAGGFTYSGCHIYSDGRVVSNSNVFNLSKANIEAFDITISNQGGMFTPKAYIDLTIDRDVILTLIDFILQNPQEPSDYIAGCNQQKTKQGSSVFLRDIVALMAKMSGADGHVSPEEVKIVKDFLQITMKLDKDGLSEAITIFNKTKTSPSSFEYFAANLRSQFINNREMLLSVLDLLFSIAIADGTLSAEEELLLLEAEAIFGVKGRAYSSFKSEHHATTSSKKVYYLNVLGLSPGSSKDEIRIKYKRLGLKFHPDRVHHLGDEIIKEAEIKMKEINQAYQYLYG